MRQDVAHSLSCSQRDFLDIVWPTIRDHCGGGYIIPVESVSASDFKSKLDTLAGIDAWQQLDDPVSGPALRGLATRIQWGADWGTFTVRMELPSGRPTEYQKRLAAIGKGRGYLYPHLTIQAYLTDKAGQLMSVGIAKTEDLIGCIGSNTPTRMAPDGNRFYYLPFVDVPHCVVGQRG